MSFKKLLFYILFFSLSSHSYAAETIIIELTIKNHRFEPSEIRVPEGKKIKLIIENQDDVIEEFESIDLHREKIIPPGRKVKVVLAPLKKGEYKFEGEFHPETAQGVLIVE